MNSDFIRFFPIFRFFPTFRLLDSTALNLSLLPQMEEKEMLRVQIAVARKSSCQGRPSSVDIYKRKVDSVKQKYEDQLKEIAEELSALKQEESNLYLDVATSFGKGALRELRSPR